MFMMDFIVLFYSPPPVMLYFCSAREKKNQKSSLSNNADTMRGPHLGSNYLSFTGKIARIRAEGHYRAAVCECFPIQRRNTGKNRSCDAVQCSTVFFFKPGEKGLTFERVETTTFKSHWLYTRLATNCGRFKFFFPMRASIRPF